MRKVYTFSLDSLDVMTIMDALESRAAAYEKTAAYFNDEKLDDLFIIEECTDADEATGIAEIFRSIIKVIEDQVAKQRS